MANATGAFGLRPARKVAGSSSWAVEKMYVSANYATALFVGDPVLYSTQLDEKDPTGHHRAVQASAGTSDTIILGAIVGIEPIQTDLNKTYLPASTGGYVYVMTDRDAIYEIRGDGGGTPTKVYVGQNAIMVATSAGSTTTGLSGFEMETTTPATAKSYPLHIVGVKDVEDNTLADDAIYLVRLNTALNAVGDILGVTST